MVAIDYERAANRKSTMKIATRDGVPIADPAIIVGALIGAGHVVLEVRLDEPAATATAETTDADR